MTLIASILFLFALAASVLAITVTVSDAMPRIVGVVEAEFAPMPRPERRIGFGVVKQRSVARTAEVVAFPALLRSQPDYRLAA